MRHVGLGLLAAVGACCAVVIAPAGPAGAAQASSAAVVAPARASAPAVVLVNAPARSVCAGHKFKVGVWFQRISGGSRAYRISVSGPRHRRFFYRAGQAPSAGWRFWKVLAGRAGKYRTVYSGHRPGSTKWTKFVARTRARHCS
jgi:hypothetical protein